jgi:hypothetical protein
VDVTVVEGEGVRAATTAQLAAGARSAMVVVPVAGTTAPWRVTARLRSGGETLTERIVITRASARLVGDSVLFRGGPSLRGPFQPTAVPVFGRTERVRVEWPAFEAADRQEVRLLNRTGQLVPIPVALTERADEAGRAIVADLALAPLAPGDYVIELTLGKGAGTEQKFVAIRVAR